jgi:hypothetical protein
MAEVAYCFGIGVPAALPCARGKFFVIFEKRFKFSFTEQLANIC